MYAEFICGKSQLLCFLILRFTPHPTLWMLEMTMHKGFKANVGCSPPYTNPTLTLHSDVITKGKSSQRQVDRESVFP